MLAYVQTRAAAAAAKQGRQGEVRIEEKRERRDGEIGFPTSNDLLHFVEHQVHQGIVSLEGSRALAAAVELDGDALVHVLAEVEDVLLLGTLALLAALSTAAVASAATRPMSAATSTASPTAPSSTAVASAATTAALVGYIGHGVWCVYGVRAFAGKRLCSGDGCCVLCL